MLHLFGGGTETRRLPGASQFPWKEIRLAVIALIAVGALVYGVTWAVSRGSENTSAPAAVQAVEQPVAQPVPSTGSGQVQQAPVVLASVAPKIVDYKVVWAEVTGFDPFTIPVEEGLYNGTFPSSISWSPTDPRDVPAGDAFAWKILPQFIGIRGNRVAAARDQNDKNISLVSIHPHESYPPYILLSVDGEKSWCMLNLLPIWEGGYQQGDAFDPRVVAMGGEIHLYVQDSSPGYHWWETVVKKSGLPCS